MKKIFYNTIAALIGIWFIIAPWVLKIFDNSEIYVWISVIVGVVLLLSSLLSFKAAAWSMLSTLAGIWFIAFPFIYTMGSAEKWSSVVLGAVAVFLNLTND